MLTDVFTHSFTQYMTHPSYAYSFLLIPCLLIIYKAPIVKTSLFFSLRKFDKQQDQDQDQKRLTLVIFNLGLFWSKSSLVPVFYKS